MKFDNKNRLIFSYNINLLYINIIIAILKMIRKVLCNLINDLYNSKSMI